MKGMLKALCFVAGVVFAAFALPASAQKTFTITPPAAVSIGTQLIQVTFTNTGNSNFNSFELDATSANLKFNTAVTPTLSQGFSGTVSIFNSTTLQFVNTTPIKTKPVTITVSVMATDNSCAAAAGTWSGGAWAGSPSSPSQTFALSPLPAATTINPGCVLGFIAQPASAQVGTTITSAPSNPSGAPVKVGLLNAGVPDPNFSGSISLAIKAGTGSMGAMLTGGGPVNASSGVATFPSLSIDTVGMNYVLTASSSGYTSVDSTSFTIFGGTLGCNNNNNFAGNANYDPELDINFVGPAGFGMRRGPNWDDSTGNNCILVDFTFTPPGNSNIASLLWDKSTGQHASFEYVIVWNPIDVSNVGGPADVWNGYRPNVSWGIDNPTVGTTDYVPALMCIDDDLTQGQAILPKIPGVPPYTTNPNPQYQPGQVAKLCIARQSFTSLGKDPHDSTKTLIQFFDEVVDEADSHVTGP
ncbi:MAG TPA: hypothetical protein VMU79_08710 [Casimicrobiaceae bacterium]|jgi:hypothetical protein|nr:hypothetical protein [Casimicrobiaceae bacterium]